LRSVLAWAVALAACSSPHEPIANRAISTAARPLDPLPFAKGATFVYDVTIVFHDATTGQSATAQFPWTMTVVDVHEDKIRISGWLQQLVDFDAKTPYTPPSPTVRELVRTDDSVSLHGERWLSLPLADGQRICPDTKSRYCWVVSADHERFRVTFVTNPDDETFEITPGVGVSRFDYHHHGTTLDVSAKLVSHPGR
jgi:hypothetical protein